MTRWETDLTTRDTNRIVRPVEWGFDWLEDFAGQQRVPKAEGTPRQTKEPGLKPPDFIGPLPRAEARCYS